MLQNDNIEEVIGRYIELTDMGSYYVAQCPFHDDNSPSLIVYPNDGENGRWRCMACSEEWGDAVSFVMQYENCSFNDAVKLASHAVKPSSLFTKLAIGMENPETVKSNLLAIAVGLQRKLNEGMPIPQLLELKKKTDLLSNGRFWTKAFKLLMKN